MPPGRRRVRVDPVLQMPAGPVSAGLVLAAPVLAGLAMWDKAPAVVDRMAVDAVPMR